MTNTEYKLIRSKRKTLSLIIDGNAELIVRAPAKMSLYEIEAFIKKKQKWICAKQQEISDINQRYEKVKTESGSHIPYLGLMCTIVKSDTTEIYMYDSKIFINHSTDIKELIKWMKKSALKLLEKRTEIFSNLMNTEYTAVKISEAKTRWGSCSGKNSINFSWRLIMCPPEIIDYVIIHELSHTIHKNHSKAFWNTVETFLPNYKQTRKWLKENYKLMDII